MRYGPARSDTNVESAAAKNFRLMPPLEHLIGYFHTRIIKLWAAGLYGDCCFSMSQENRLNPTVSAMVVDTPSGTAL